MPFVKSQKIYMLFVVWTIHKNSFKLDDNLLIEIKFVFVERKIIWY